MTDEIKIDRIKKTAQITEFVGQDEFSALLYKTFELNKNSGLLGKDPKKTAEKLYRLTEIMLEVNSVMNLTSITSPGDIVLKHYLDSLTLSEYIPENSTIIDIGCGAGFPSLPLAIARPDLKIIALDSTAKRINYINETAKKLGLDNIHGVAARAEDYVVKPCELVLACENYSRNSASLNRESFDFAVARAVAPLNILCELCIPYVRVGGMFISMKGRSDGTDEEIRLASSAISKLGGDLFGTERIRLYRSPDENTDTSLPDGDFIERSIVKIKKVKNTPKNFPRNYSSITKKPL
ncbi:MAG: 16S rRNA (guanine(527)-N(7))-methyltransferase RsmG [Clostridia bacterium]|nr:16S rRNA (guanine(527)-N(7))-methyltransferase RsmG [Clostridia bacterium]